LETDSINATASSPPKVSRWKAIFPPAQWVPSYEARWLKDDLFAGITLAAYAIPVALAYATLAGLPPQVGVYGYLLGGLGYALFGSSRHLAIGPTSAISLMVGVSVVPLATGDPVRYAQIASLSAFVAAAMCVVAWLLRLSTLTSFIIDHILRVVLDRVEAEGKSLRLVVCDLSTSPRVDLAGTRMFLELGAELTKRGIILRLVEARASVRDLLRIEGAENRVGRIDFLRW
jgi:MFS superfamily sulfate permease-like transporter